MVRSTTGRRLAGTSRWLLARALALLAALSLASGAWAPRAACATPAAFELSGAQQQFLERLQHDTFAFFWDTSASAHGLTPDRFPALAPGLDISSVAAVGFALTSYPIAVEKGWITRDQAARRTLSTLRFLWRAPQGPEPTGVTGYQGFFYHFLDARTGYRSAGSELSTIDTALFLQGALGALEYFNDPAVSDAMARQGNVIKVAPADQAMPFFRSELARYAKLVKKAGVELQ